MALNTFKCNQLTPLHLKGLKFWATLYIFCISGGAIDMAVSGTTVTAGYHNSSDSDIHSPLRNRNWCFFPRSEFVLSVTSPPRQKWSLASTRNVDGSTPRIEAYAYLSRICPLETICLHLSFRFRQVACTRQSARWSRSRAIFFFFNQLQALVIYLCVYVSCVRNQCIYHR